MAKKVWEAGGTTHSWDPDMIRSLTAEERRVVAQHERLHLEASRPKMTVEAYRKALAELNRLEEGTWPATKT